MHGLIQLQLCVGSDIWLIPVSQDTSVDKLLNAITKKYAIGINGPRLRLLCGDNYLEMGNKKFLRDYSLTHLSTVVAIIPVCGGILPLQDGTERKADLVPLRGFTTVTSSPTEPDMITLDDCPDEKRARMPCGHVIGPDSMTSYCQSVLSKGEFKFYCPSVDRNTGKANCNREWEYFLVRHVAYLSSEEMKVFEKKISDNYLQKAKGIQTCPGCKTWCYKEDATGSYVGCPLCGRSFCWACLRDWLGPSNGQVCGNSDCDGRDSRTRLLANCPTKKIYSCRACPTMRVCPKCGIMAEHKDACAHVTCTGCGHGYCFICLKGKTSIGAWPCPPDGKCALAPRQTSTSWRAPGSQSSTSPASQSNTTPAIQPENNLPVPIIVIIVIFLIAAILMAPLLKR